MDQKLISKAGQAIYGRRKMIVEPVFGQIKSARDLDRFRLRGLEKVNGGWALMATTHNVLKLFWASLAAARVPDSFRQGCDWTVGIPEAQSLLPGLSATYDALSAAASEAKPKPVLILLPSERLLRFRLCLVRLT
jgi:hypothetical protein